MHALHLIRFAFARRLCLTVALALTVASTLAQEALRNSMAGQAAAEARRINLENIPYTLKSGDLRLRVVPSLDVEWNDNVNTTHSDTEDDYILRPLVQFVLNYPVTEYNLLNLDVGFGYDKYFKHDNLSAWRLQSGSQLSFDIYVKDVSINLHDRFSYVQDSSQEAAASGSGNYGNFDNTAGVLVSWDLNNVTLSLGYDHQYVYSPASEYDSQNQNTDMLLGRAGLQLNPALIAGLETTGSWTRYENPTLNNNMGYSFGAYADWMPGSYVHIQPRAGWTGMHFEQTSDSIKTSDINSWYANLTIIHAPTEAINYSFSVGHELRGGIESDAIEDTYARLAATWNAMKFLSMTTSLSYEHGKAGVGNDTGNLKETYDWFSGALGFSCPITERATLGLNYRLTLRSSDVSDNGYTQNMVSLHFNYAL